MSQKNPFDRLVNVPPGESLPTRIPMMPLYRVLARYEDTNQRWSSIEASVTQQLPLHVHHHDEAVYILEGELEYFCGGKLYHATPGTFMLLPGDVPHCPRPLGNKPPRVLTIQSPGDFGRLAEAMLSFQHAGKRDFTTPEYLAAVAKHGWELVDADFWKRWDAQDPLYHKEFRQWWDTEGRKKYGKLEVDYNRID